MYREAHLFDCNNLQDFIEKLAKLPSSTSRAKAGPTPMSMDVEGYIVEKLSGKRFPTSCATTSSSRWP